MYAAKSELSGYAGSFMAAALQGGFSGNVFCATGRGVYVGVQASDDVYVIYRDVTPAVSFGLSLPDGLPGNCRLRENAEVRGGNGMLSLGGEVFRLRFLTGGQDPRETEIDAGWKHKRLSAKTRGVIAGKTGIGSDVFNTLKILAHAVYSGGGGINGIKPQSRALDTRLTPPAAAELRGFKPFCGVAKKSLQASFFAPGIKETVFRLIGWGKGLTPSADDALCGLLYAFRTLGRTGCRFAGLDEFTGAVEAACLNTGRISAAYLRAACGGGEYPPADNLLKAVFYGKGSINAAAGRLLDVGHSSGADILTGIAAAVNAAGGMLL